MKKAKHKKNTEKKQQVRYITTLSFFIISFLISISLIKYVSNTRQNTVTTQADTNAVTFTPTIIPFSDAEIGNPWRTPLYAGDEQPPPGLPFSEQYQRWCWADIEPTQGQYNFSVIDALMATAKADGGKAGFRIMPVNTSGQTDNCLPSYLATQVGDPPDWNNPEYLTAAQNLLTALGQRYDSDPRMGWFEMGPYGNWGEWNLSGLPQNPMSAANKQKLIQMNRQAFPHKTLLIGTDAHIHDGGGFDAMSYALSLSPAIGLRSDCLGSSDLGGAVDDFAVALDRWKTAPIILEYCGGANFTTAYTQITTYHATMVADGDGNLQAFNSYNSADQQQIVTNFKTAGYRFILDSMTLPGQITTGNNFTVATKWSNVNITPAYIPWNVMIQLRNSTGTVVWQGKSQTNLETLLPTNSSGTDTPVTTTDTFTLPTSITSGTYTVAVQVTDPDSYYKPLNLAIQGKQTDGSYSLGTITVTSSGISQTSPVVTAATLPTPTVSVPALITPTLVCMGSCPTPSIAPTTAPAATNVTPIPSQGTIDTTTQTATLPSMIQSLLAQLMQFFQSFFSFF